jgi:hypothetical protein
MLRHVCLYVKKLAEGTSKGVERTKIDGNTFLQAKRIYREKRERERCRKKKKQKTERGEGNVNKSREERIEIHKPKEK